ncbi:MAG: BON domain-containing protein [Azoarcus sp.]|jgi:osmotically-inducible protein OsmY|nr:BON domain-containing protein [Azoarcus sp.]
MKTSLFSPRRAVLFGAFCAAALPLLQGCFPLVAGGVVAGAVMIADRRTSGTYVDDQSIEMKAGSLIKQHFGTLNHVNVTSYNRNVLLTGEVRDEQTQAEIQRLAGTVANVRAVTNELVIAPPSSLGDRANDAMISTNVKTRFLNDGKFHANHVKVITEAHTVFLLGIVTHAEGDEAAELARSSSGVQKVVKVFEYIDGNRAEVLDHSNAHRNDPPEVPEAP